MEGVLFVSVGFVIDRAGIGGTRVRTLARKKKEKLQNGERKQREKVKADFREAVHTSQQGWEPQEKVGGHAGKRGWAVGTAGKSRAGSR